MLSLYGMTKPIKFYKLKFMGSTIVQFDRITLLTKQMHVSFYNLKIM